MSVCWHLVCDETREQLWCGQGNYLYSGEDATMKMLETFLYMTRGMELRVVTDLEWDGSEDYVELSGTYNEHMWDVWTDTEYLGKHPGTWRQAVERACRVHFPDEKFYGSTLVCGSHNFYYEVPGTPLIQHQASKKLREELQKEALENLKEE